jgi:uncharacterized protein
VTHTARAGLLVVGTALLLTAHAGCSRTDSPQGRQLAIATGDETGVYYLLGRALAAIFNDRVPGVAATALETTGSGFNVQAVEEGRAQLGFSQADVAYLALLQGTRSRRTPHRHLRAVAVLYVNAVQVVTRRESAVHELDDLADRRVGVGAPDSGTELAAQIILREQGLNQRIHAEPLTYETVASGMQNGSVDAGFLVSSYPVPAIARLDAVVGVRLIPVRPDLAARIRAQYPFYRPIVVPDGTYTAQGGDVPTIGVDNLLVCGSDLPDDLVYQLTRTLFEQLPTLSRAHTAAAAIDPDNAAAAPIPLHPGAARYYRERELFR